MYFGLFCIILLSVVVTTVLFSAEVFSCDYDNSWTAALISSLHEYLDNR